jgi:hypothetical protein
VNPRVSFQTIIFAAAIDSCAEAMGRGTAAR